jgi:hypothetical protein
MSVRGALGTAAADFYRQSWRLLLLNAVLGAMVAAVVLAALASLPAVVFAALLGPFAAALMYCTVRVAQGEELRLADALTGLRCYWRRGLALAGLLLAVGVVGAVTVRFYSHAGAWAWPLAALSAYLLVALALLQLALWPLAVFEADRPFRAVLRDAVSVLVRKPAGFAGLALALVLVNAIGLAAAVLPFLTLTIAYSFLVSAHYSLPRNPDREV